MPDILHRVVINAKPARVFAALSTIEGLRGWWIVETAGDPKRGGVIDFGFTGMKVVASRPGSLVRWRCVRGPKEWLGTEVTFQLTWKDRQTFVLFRHAKWKKPVEFMHHCSTKWATFLLSLRDLVERSEGRPYPYDIKIHVDD
jgi:uncharacterized protein YndB with AHSA1/START domain